MTQGNDFNQAATTQLSGGANVQEQLSAVLMALTHAVKYATAFVPNSKGKINCLTCLTSKNVDYPLSVASQMSCLYSLIYHY